MQLPDNLPGEVVGPLQRLLTEFGRSTFSMSDIIGYIERNRQKTLRIEKDTMPVGMTGYAIGLRDCDLICTAYHLSEAQQTVTTLHEMGHFIRGDIPKLTSGEETDTYAGFIQRRDRHTLPERRERFIEMYRTPREHNTELLARIMLQYIREHDEMMSDLARQVYLGE